MNPDRLLGLPEEEARLLCEHYNYKFAVTGEDNEFYFVVPNSWDDPDRVLVYLAGGVVEEAHFG